MFVNRFVGPDRRSRAVGSGGRSRGDVALDATDGVPAGHALGGAVFEVAAGALVAVRPGQELGFTLPDARVDIVAWQVRLQGLASSEGGSTDGSIDEHVTRPVSVATARLPFAQA